ncbi:MFS transporter [Sphingomonas sp. 2SG]|uniref:MFS transporter n=1 Tax=Sphingomonas sp. 2SG TaxID=2502201 RepID=UPI0010F53432|nr:MFS transporter [Sphingomonas sp. 2SG]
MTEIVTPVLGPRPAVGWPTLVFYGLGACSTGIKMRALSSFLLIYYNQVLGLRPTTVALAISIITVFDAIVDPITGYISDNTRSRLGRRHPFMYASALPIGLSFLMLWNPPAWMSSDGLFFYLLGCLMALRLFDTFFELPSIALAPELVAEYHRRTLIVSMRIFFRTFAGALFTIAAFQIFLSPEHGGVTDRSGYLSFAIAGSTAMVVSILLSSAATQRYIPWLRKPAPSAGRSGGGGGRFFRDVLGLFKEPAARVMLGAGMLVAVVSGARTGLDLYFGLYFWGLAQGQLAVLASLTAVATLVGAVILQPIAKRMDKRSGLITIYTLAMITGALPILLRLFNLLPANGRPALFTILAVEIVIQGVLYVMSASIMNSMLSDVVEELEVKTGKRSEGLLFSADAFFSKAVSGLGVLISGGVLWLVAFPSKAAPGSVPMDTLWRLGAVYLLVSLLLMIVVLLLIRRFPIDRARHDRNLELIAGSKEP